MLKRNLIFDFDGTLVNSQVLITAKLNQLAEEFKFSPLNNEIINNLGRFSSKELIAQLNIPFYQLPKIILRAQKLISLEMQTLAPIEGLIDVLQKIYDQQHCLGLLTSNSKENVCAWLQHHRLENLFSFIYADKQLFGKAHRLKKIIQVHRLEKSQTYYIGDETRDIDAAKAAGIISVAVTWGFQQEKVLMQSVPHLLARYPKDLWYLFKN